MLLPSLLVLVACTPTPDGEGEPAGGDTAPAAEGDALHGRVDTIGDRDVIYLWGTREEMGYAEGALYCDRVAPLFKEYLLEHLVANYSGYAYDVARPYVLAMTAFEEDDLRELEAMYQGMVDTCTEEQLTIESSHLEARSEGRRMLELEDLLFANAIADFGCSSFTAWGAATTSGDTIHGRNFDWATDPQGAFLDGHVLKVYDSEEEGARWVSVGVPALTGCITCVTEEAVGLTMHNVSGLEPTYEVNISPRMFAARAALAATWEAEDPIAAAEEVLESRRQLVGNNLHLSFPTARGGGIGGVVFEYDGDHDHADGQVTVRWPGEDPDKARTEGIAATNHYVKRRAPELDGDSYERQRSLLAAIDAAETTGGLALDDGHAMMGAVVNGYSGLTVHTILVDAAARELRVHVAADPTSPAPLAEPVTVNLDDLFAGLP